MSKPSRSIAAIKDELVEAHKDINEHLHMLLEKQQRAMDLQKELAAACFANQKTTPRVNKLSNEEIARYSRQLIIPGFGVTGQEKIGTASILIVGMGGLGCPAAQYLSSAGVGNLGFIDYDLVEASNFHRQTLHAELNVGMSKVESARHSIRRCNSHCQVTAYNVLLDHNNALDIIQRYDVVLDCTDNMATRYLLNDACVLANKPLVSGSALQLDGQLTVYNYGDTSPCYRCIFPKPPPPETVNNCSDAGVLGAITGVIGSLQALEAIKIVVGLGEVLAGRMLLFEGGKNSFRCVKLRQKHKDCAVCSDNPSIKHLINYEQFCKQLACDKHVTTKLLPAKDRLLAHYYHNIVKEGINHVLIDVRSPAEFEICHLPNSINIPLADVLNNKYLTVLKQQLRDEVTSIIVVCRRGNDSQIAVTHIRKQYPDRVVGDISGGLHQWHYQLDPDFPLY